MRWSDEEYKAYLEGKPNPSKKKSKYHNKKTAVDGMLFDSKKEAERYCELNLLQREGKINKLELQPVFPLLEAFEYRGEKIRPVLYVADFQYVDLETGEEVVEDVKGMKTDVYKMKRKLFLHRYGDRYRFLES